MKNDRKIRAVDALYLAGLLGVGIFFILFYRRFLVYSYDIDYHRIFAEKLFNMSLEDMAALDSNIPVHAVTYPFYHLVLKALAFVLRGNFHLATYLTLAGVNICSVLLFRKLMHILHVPQNRKEELFINVTSVAAILFVVARSPLTGWRFYAVQCAPNPVHNPTVLFIRPFGIAAFIAFCLVLTKWEKGEKYGSMLAFFGSMVFLSILGKPNYAFTFLPAMGLVTLGIMIGRKTLKIGFALLGVLLPSLILLVAQFAFLSRFTTAVKLQVVIGGFTGMNPVQVLAASLAAFPAVILLISRKDFKENVFYRTSIAALLIGWLQMYLLSNGPSGDFSWGYDLAIQFAYVISVACAMSRSGSKWRKGAAYLLFAYQAICGIQYIVLVWKNVQFLI